MASASQSAPTSKKMLWASYIISAIPVLMLLTSAAAKFVKPAPVVQGFTQQFGFPASYISPIGILELACTVLYLIPRTSVLGAILLTGYLGGATVTHLRVGDPAFVGAVIVGIFVWGGLFFRESRVRALIPFRKPNVD
jgi:DoxX-like family